MAEHDVFLTLIPVTIWDMISFGGSTVPITMATNLDGGKVSEDFRTAGMFDWALYI